jgi:hypothetical protein
LGVRGQVSSAFTSNTNHGNREHPAFPSSGEAIFPSPLMGEGRVGGSPPNEYVATTSDTPDASHRASLRRIGFLCDESHFHATYETLFPRRRLNCLRNLRLRRTRTPRHSHPRCDISSNRETYRRLLRRMKSQSVGLLVLREARAVRGEVGQSGEECASNTDHPAAHHNVCSPY